MLELSTTLILYSWSGKSVGSSQERKGLFVELESVSVKDKPVGAFTAKAEGRLDSSSTGSCGGTSHV